MRREERKMRREERKREESLEGRGEKGRRGQVVKQEQECIVCVE